MVGELSSAGNSGAGIMTFIFFVLFLILIALIFIFSYFLKKNGNLKIGSSAIYQEIQRFYFTPKNFIVLLKIEKEVILLGVTDNNISFLKQIEDKETLDKIFLELGKNNGKSFVELFGVNKDAGFESLKNRLKKMRHNKNETD